MNFENNIIISFLIVSWNVKDYIKDCLESISQIPNSEVVVFDNFSNDGTTEMIKSQFPDVNLIESDINYGFAKGNNLGYKFCKGKFIFVLNPDTIVDSDFTLTFLNELIDRNDVGILCPKIIYGNGLIQKSSARLYPKLASHLTINILKLNKIPGLSFLNKILKYPYDYNLKNEIQCGSGAAFIVKSELYRKLNGFYDGFPHTGEDVDFFIRAKKIGFKTFYDPNIIIKHFAGQSSKKDIVRVQLNTIYSTLIYFRRNYSRFSYYFYLILIYFIELPLILARIFLIKDTTKLNSNLLMFKFFLLNLKPIKNGTIV